MLARVLLPLLLLAPADPRTDVLGGMRGELDRSLARLRLTGYEAPYFIGYTVRDYEAWDVAGKFGAVYQNQHARQRQTYVEVRVGDYQFDNFANESGGEPMFDMNDFEKYSPSTDAPIDNDVQALRGTLWLLTDYKYKRALAALNKKRGQRATDVVEDEQVASFAKNKPTKHMDPPAQLRFDPPAWEVRVRKTTALLNKYPEIFDASMKVGADKLTRYIVNSEGGQIVTERVLYSVQLEAATRAADGMYLEHSKSFYARTPEEMPSDAQLETAAKELASELTALRKAPMLDPYNGPAILLPQAAGVFFHEALGHRLEGERQNDEKEGRTFKGQIGRQVLPSYVSVIDDPTMERAGARSMNGFYRFDDEGVAAQKVTLVDHGVLKSYLMSRTPIKGAPQSNGHGRAESNNKPMGRMATTVVMSDKKVDYPKLKQMLLEEVRRQGKPFGLIVSDITGGSTNTTNYDYQAFKGMARLVFKVDAKTGAETLVRGVEFVGTPLSELSKIVATSDKADVFNGFCGAESGFVPVSTYAPAVLMREIELQRTKRGLERPIVLPAPWNDPPTQPRPSTPPPPKPTPAPPPSGGKPAVPAPEPSKK
jgi:predicted Zn-dependent protease